MLQSLLFSFRKYKQQDGYCDMLLLTVHVAINEASVLASLIILKACDNDGQQSLLRRYPAILQTPLSVGGVIDSYVWNFSRNGIYTVRRFGGFRKDNSAFYVFVLLRNKDVIPVHFNLCKRHVQADKIFSFCPQHDETFAVKYQIHYITVLNNLRKEGEFYSVTASSSVS
ncbi:hypothetical protein D5086_017284 [Populus alba]|uniref:Uncharacterized protein n=1 Tax=Populus alba TaxID=43335 RepID=A0ACC4BXQ5_POPAL